MIAGLGTDMIEVERIAAKSARNRDSGNWCSRKMKSIIVNQRQTIRTLCARFAAKEAFFKALEQMEERNCI